MQPEFLGSLEAPTQQETISFVTAPFQIRHPDGTVLLALELGKTGPVLRLFDYEGKPAFELSADREMGTALYLQSAHGKDLVSLVDNGEGGPVSVHANKPEDEMSDHARVELFAGAEVGEISLRREGRGVACLDTSHGGHLRTRTLEA